MNKIKSISQNNIYILTAEIIVDNGMKSFSKITLRFFWNWSRCL